jgi:hypothetical protein
VFPIRLFLFLIFPLAPLACTGAESYSDRHKVQIVSAQRYVLRSKAADGTRIRNQWKGRATEVAKSLLEELVLRGARVLPYQGVNFPKHYGGRRGFSGKPSYWIRCSFNNGQDVDIHVYPPGPFAYVEGDYRYRLNLSEDSMQALLAPSAWDTSSPPQGQAPEIVANDWIHRNLCFEDSSLDKSPVMGQEGRLLVPVSAKLYSTFYCRCPLDDTDHQCDLVLAGKAKQEMILRLKKILHGSRLITLEFFPDGTRRLPTWLGDGPSKQIVCTMDNGSKVILEHFPKPDAWCVRGEEGLRLDLWNRETSRILAAQAWEPLWQAVDD